MLCKQNVLYYMNEVFCCGKLRKECNLLEMSVG